MFYDGKYQNYLGSNKRYGAPSFYNPILKANKIFVWGKKKAFDTSIME